MQIVIFTEAGNGFGYGHLSRCLALKQGFEEYGADVSLITRGDANCGYKKAEWLEGVCLDGADIAVIDSYHAPKNLYEEVAKGVKLGVWFDDDNRLDYPLGFIINSAKTPILRKPFWDNAKKEISGKINKIFISFGSAPEKLTSLVLAVHKRYPDAHLMVTTKIEANFVEFISGLNAAGLANKMKECDLAICAGGQTMQELSALGIPTVAIILANNQIKTVKSALASGEIISAVNLTEGFEEVVLKALRAYKINPIVAQTKNVALDIIKTVTSNELRNDFEIDGFWLKSYANIDKREALQILEWRNDAEVRKWSLNSQKVKQADHLAFVKSRRNDEKSFYWLAHFENEPIGVVSLPKIDWQNMIGYVGVYIKPNLKGQGFGAKLVKICAEIAFKKALLRKTIAEIASQNIASIKVHEKYGYIKEGIIKNYFLNGGDLLFFGVKNG